jgi:PiT family inorganic phosphate transporter
MDYGTTFIVLACVFGLIMAWGIGANDVANAMGTSVGSGAITLKQAVIIAAVFEFAGAFLAGGQVTKTIRKGIVDSSLLVDQPELLVFGMLSSLLAAGIWLLLASRKGWPVSTTHSIIGALVGFAAVGIGMDAVKWSKVGGIVLSWIISPAIAGIFSYWVFRSVQKFILNTDNPFESAKRYVPVYIFMAGFVIALVTIFKGLKHVGLDLSTEHSFIFAALFGVVVMIIGIVIIRRIKLDPAADKDFHYANVERIFTVLMVVTACAMAFAHGSNDVANAIGPMAAVLGIVQSGGEVAQKSVLPLWVLVLGGAGIVAGLLMYGQKVMRTIGKQITELTPSRGFACELSAATTVVLASGVGIPVSTTQTLVGAVLGVGLARGIAALNLRVVRTIFLSWIVTLPVGALFSIIIFFILKGIFT